MRRLTVSATFLLLLSPEAFGATFRWASSSNRIYVEGGGTATLSDIKAALPGAPLELVDPQALIWLLRANLFVRDGSVLRLHGGGAGGDVNELRLQSNNSTAPGSIIEIIADHGTLDILGTRITSWDLSKNGPDTEYANYGRSFLRVRSRLAADGVTPLESRMDIVDSDVGYLGYANSESYGLSWKVVGSGADLYDKVQVWGNIINSRIHHNYFGVYTYGLQDGLWRDNEVHDNVQYGFDPHDDSDNIVIENNDVHHNGNHGIIASRRCDHLVIRGNTSWANDGNGIMLHRSSDDALVEDNAAHDNTDSGIAIFASNRTTIRNNVVLNNAKAGVRFSVGASDNVVEDNEVGVSGKYGLYFYKGSDAPEPGDDGRLKRNVFRNNFIHRSQDDTIKMSDGEGNRFIGNRFENGDKTMRFQNSRGTEFTDNQLQPDQIFRVSGSSSTASTITFAGHPRVKLQLDDFSTGVFTDPGNAIFDPDEIVFTEAGPGGSSLRLSAAEIGTTTTVFRRALFAQPDGTTVWVNPTLWNTGGDRAKAWSARSADGNRSVTYRVGDLAPGANYQVRQDNKPVGSFTADGAGMITFSVTPGSTSTLAYSVQPQ